MEYIPLESLSLNRLGEYSSSCAIVFENSLQDNKDTEQFKRKKKEVERAFRDLLLVKFQKHFQLPNLTSTKFIFEHALLLSGVKWNGAPPLEPLKLERILNAFSEALCYSGRGVYSAVASKTPQGLIIDFLLSRSSELPASELLKNAKSLFLEKDPDFFSGFQQEWQRIIDETFCEIEKGTLDTFLTKNFIGNLLCLLPYTHPQIGSVFHIPVYEHRQWKKIQYTIDKKISLTPKWYSSPLPAYGLVAKDGPPILAFQGSTFPSGDGFWAALLSDFCFGLPVGRLPTLLGKKPLYQWMRGKKNIQMFGVSLGGAIALNVVRECPHFFSSVNVYNPPGFYPWNRRKIDGVEINILSQWNDLVSTVGLFPEGSKINIYRVLLEVKENFMMAHNRAYSGAKQVVYVKTSSQIENRRVSRVTLAGLHLLLPLLFFPVFTLHLFCRLFSRTFAFISNK